MGLGDVANQCLWASGICSTLDQVVQLHGFHWFQAIQIRRLIPVRQQADVPSPNLNIKKSLHFKCLLIFQHKIHGAAKLMGEDTQRSAFVVFLCQPINILFRLIRWSKEKYDCFLNRLLQVMIPDFSISFTSPFTVWLFFRTDEPGIGREILHRRESFNCIDFVKDHHG